MAAPKLYKIKSATWQSAAIVHAVAAAINFEGSEQMARGDGASAMQLAWVEGVHARITVTALEGLLTDAHILPGTGALVVTTFEQAPGEGQAASGDKIWTFALATFTGQRRGAPLDGLPTVEYSFIGVAASGLSADIFAIT